MSAAGGGLGDVFVSRRMAAHEWTAWRVQLLESRVMAALVVEHPKHFRENPIVAVCEHIDHQLKAQRERFSPFESRRYAPIAALSSSSVSAMILSPTTHYLE